MTEPKRMLDEERTGLEATLLRAGRSYSPPASAKRAVLGGLGLGSAVTLAGSADAAAKLVAKTALAKLFGTKLGVGALVVGLTAASVGGIAYERRASSRDAPPPVTMLPAAAPAAAPAPVLQAAAPELSPGASQAREPAPSVVAHAPPARSATLAAPTAASASAASSIPDELARLDRVRAAQQAHDYARASAELVDYRRAHPKGELAMEAAVLRIEVTEAAGDRAGARALAERFLAAHPRGLLSARVRSIQERTSAPEGAGNAP